MKLGCVTPEGGLIYDPVEATDYSLATLLFVLLCVPRSLPVSGVHTGIDLPHRRNRLL